MTLGNRIAVLNKGKLMQLDTPLHLYNNPANKFVAGFIGSPAMNFLQGTIQHEGDYFFTHETGNCKIFLGSVLASGLEKYVGRQIQIGIRPEDIFITEDADANFDCKLKLMAFENMGNEQLVYLSLAAQTLIARRPSSETVEIGNEIGIKFLKNKIIFMDVESGKVISK